MRELIRSLVERRRSLTKRLGAALLGDVEGFTRLFPNQDTAMSTLIAQVEKSTSVDLLEYAGATTLPLIRAIRDKAVPLRLLVKHPDTVEEVQRQRTLTTLDTLFKSVFHDYVGQFEIRCYRLPYSLRGRYFRDKALELGWLTPDLLGQTTHGSKNLSVFFSFSNQRNEEAVRLFVRTFDDYWTDSQTEEALTVLTRYESERPRQKRSGRRQG